MAESKGNGVRANALLTNMSLINNSAFLGIKRTLLVLSGEFSQ